MRISSKQHPSWRHQLIYLSTKGQIRKFHITAFWKITSSLRTTVSLFLIKRIIALWVVHSKMIKLKENEFYTRLNWISFYVEVKKEKLQRIFFSCTILSKNFLLQCFPLSSMFSLLPCSPFFRFDLVTWKFGGKK